MVLRQGVSAPAYAVTSRQHQLGARVQVQARGRPASHRLREQTRTVSTALFTLSTRLLTVCLFSSRKHDTLATGVVFFHRFYMFHSFKEFNNYVRRPYFHFQTSIG